MKRCPQCEFIYEEEQSHCDMDGTALLHDPDALPSISSEPASGKTSKWKSRLWIVVPAIVVALIALVATLPTQTGPTSTGVEVQASQSPENAAATGEPNSNHLSSSETDEAVANVDNNALDGKRRAPSTTTRTRANPSRQPAASNPPATRANKPANTSSRDQAQARPAPTPANKKENRIGSIFNKAKKILKKPF